MNWYSLYRHASPPLPVTIPEDFGKHWGGITRTDERMKQETADKEQEKNHKFLGNGVWGLVVDIGDNKAMKYIFDRKEAAFAKSLIANTEYPIVRIYDVTQIQETPPIWSVTMEKVKPYDEVDPHRINLHEIEVSLKEKLRPIGLGWDVKSSNIGFNSKNEPVLFDLGIQFAKIPEGILPVANASWYNLYRQASPPLPVTVPKNQETFGVKNLKKNMSQDTADKEKKRNPQFIGSGSCGVVADIGGGKVIKYIIDEEDAVLAQNLIGNTNLPIAKIFEVIKVQESPPVWGIIMEKVKPYREVDPRYTKWVKIHEELRTKLKPIKLHWDLHTHNVGWNSNNEPVLLDVQLEPYHWSNA